MGLHADAEDVINNAGVEESGILPAEVTIEEQEARRV
jgi:hypothetical protein